MIYGGAYFSARVWNLKGLSETVQSVPNLSNLSYKLRIQIVCDQPDQCI